MKRRRLITGFISLAAAFVLSGCKDGPEPVVPTVETVSSVTEITATTATSGGEVTIDGDAAVTSRGVCWGTASGPTTAGNKTTDGEGSGAFTSKLTGLTPGTMYYLRAYAVNSAGTGYGDQVTFTTLDVEGSVSTSDVTLITPTSAQSGGTVSYEGGGIIAERGICWATQPAPTIDGSKATAGMGTGEFTAKLTGLSPSTTYYVRAYAINSAGTAYGNEITFTTLSGESNITTAEAGNITATSARSGGEIADDGGSAVIARGVCWATSPNPTAEGEKTTNGSGTGGFESRITGLIPATTYYLRAYATGKTGTEYGNEVTFTTLSGEAAITTVEADNIGGTSARSGGEVTDDGGSPVTVKGVCWSKSKNPTVSDNKTINGPGTGSFLNDLEILAPDTQYYVRAYATNELGDTYYGNEVTFKTLDLLMKLTPGMLQTTIEAAGLENTSSLKISGTIDQRDFAYMQSLVDNRSLRDIDLADVTVAAYGRYPANGIPASAFNRSSSLVSFVFPAEITSIGDNAFGRCTGLTGSLTIPEGVTFIGENAFYNCTGLAGLLTIPHNVTSIGDWAFYNCTGFVGSLAIGASVTSIGWGAFYGCSGFTGSLTIPEGVTSIGSNAFRDCSGFTGSLIIPDSVTSIGNGAFYGCRGFTGSLTIPDSVISILYDTFLNCSGFNGSLTIGNGVTFIEYSAFYGCSGFTGSLTIGNSVTSIGNSAFSRCSGFTGSLTFPDSVTRIGYYAFENCSGFTGSLTIGKSVTAIISGAFSGCSGFTGELAIPDTVESIGGKAFKGCNALSSIKVAWETPITYEQDMLPSAKTVNVPSASVSLYEAADGWKEHPIAGY